MKKLEGRFTVRLGNLKSFVEAEAKINGTVVSEEIRLLVEEALRIRYKQRTFAQIIEYADIWVLNEQTGIPVDRLATLACEIESPTLVELVKLAKVFPMDASELAELSKLKPRCKDNTNEEKGIREYVSIG